MAVLINTTLGRLGLEDFWRLPADEVEEITKMYPYLQSVLMSGTVRGVPFDGHHQVSVQGRSKFLPGEVLLATCQACSRQQFIVVKAGTIKCENCNGELKF